ncbi:MAG: hypothetical protein QXT34_02430 [Candidatus Aenigmatarchaeota archaeon]
MRRKVKNNIETLLNDFQNKKNEKIKNEELIKTLMNFAVIFFFLSLLPIIGNIQAAQVILPTVFAFSPTLSLAYFVAILILYRYYKHKENREKD